jgi:hypothetical protein
MLRTGSNRRASKLLTVLQEHGVAGGPVDDIPADSFVTHWGDTEAFGSEAMVWHGHASASMLLTGETIACDVFITSKSLVWGKDARSPISRVPISAIRDVTPGHAGSRGHQPAAYIGIGDGEFDRVEFTFTFDSYESADRNALERAAFIVHLRSRNVALSHPAAPKQPWMRAPQHEPLPSPIWPSSVTANRGQYDLTRSALPVSVDTISPTTRVSNFRDPAERLRPDRGVITAHDWSSDGQSVSSWPATVLPMARTVNGVALEEPNPDEDRVLSEFSPPESPVRSADRSNPAPMPIEDPVRAYETEALSSLNEVLSIVRRRESGEKLAHANRRPPSGAALATALASVVDRVERDLIDPEAALLKKRRLLTLDDVSRRLDVLLPLHANGAISIRELRDRTDALCVELNGALFSGSR